MYFITFYYELNGIKKSFVKTFMDEPAMNGWIKAKGLQNNDRLKKYKIPDKYFEKV